MTDYTTRPGGVLFRRHDKKADNHPDYTGEVKLDRALVDELVAQLQANPIAKLDLAAWMKQSPKGHAYLSLSPKKPYVGGSDQPQRRDTQPQPQPRRSPPPDLDDDIPF